MYRSLKWLTGLFLNSFELCVCVCVLLLFVSVLAGQTVRRMIPRYRDLCPLSLMMRHGRNQSLGFASCECWTFPTLLLFSYFLWYRHKDSFTVFIVVGVQVDFSIFALSWHLNREYLICWDSDVYKMSDNKTEGIHWQYNLQKIIELCCAPGCNNAVGSW